jgi:osmoprotectant transport system permease protein
MIKQRHADPLIKSRWLVPSIYLLLFLLWIFFSNDLIKALSPWLPPRNGIVMRTSLPVLALQHVIIVALSTSAAILTAMGMAVAVRLSRSDELKTSVLTAGSIAETIPSAAIIALAVPILGYGNAPSLLALYLYAILPVVRNAIVGMESVPPSVSEAAEGMGMTRLQQLLRVDLPLARPVLFAGIRTAIVINISLATIGATVGAGGFGVPIIAGIRTYDPVMVIQGSIPVMLMAFLADRIFRADR